jgi:hypothetical protein
MADEYGLCYWCLDKPSPEIIPAIDTRNPWVEPTIQRRPWNTAWDDLERAGAL